MIPPFVPRDKRGGNTWDKGMITKSASDKMILAGSHGDFLIRETKKGDRHVICVNDQGGLYETYIRHVGGTSTRPRRLRCPWVLSFSSFIQGGRAGGRGRGRVEGENLT